MACYTASLPTDPCVHRRPQTQYGGGRLLAFGPIEHGAAAAPKDRNYETFSPEGIDIRSVMPSY